MWSTSVIVITTAPHFSRSEPFDNTLFNALIHPSILLFSLHTPINSIIHSPSTDLTYLAHHTPSRLRPASWLALPLPRRILPLPTSLTPKSTLLASSPSLRSSSH